MLHLGFSLISFLWRAPCKRGVFTVENVLEVLLGRLRSLPWDRNGGIWHCYCIGLRKIEVSSRVGEIRSFSLLHHCPTACRVRKYASLCLDGPPAERCIETNIAAVQAKYSPLLANHTHGTQASSYECKKAALDSTWVPKPCHLP